MKMTQILMMRMIKTKKKKIKDLSLPKNVFGVGTALGFYRSDPNEEFNAKGSSAIQASNNGPDVHTPLNLRQGQTT